MAKEAVIAQKAAQVAELTEKMRAAQGGVLVDYCGLTVEEDTELRAKFREAGVEYKVIKNTMTGRAAKEAGYEELIPELNGPTALALCATDALAPAKVVAEFAKKHENLEVKAGILTGKVVDAKTVAALADIPGKEVLLARLLGSLTSGVRGFAIAVKAVADQKAEG